MFLPAPRLGLLAGFGPSPHVQTEMKGPIRWPPPAKPGLPDGALPDVLTPLSLRLTRAHQSVEEDRRLRGNGRAVLSDCGVCAPRANNKPTQTSGHAHNLPHLTAFQHKRPRWRQHVPGWTMKDRCSPQTWAGVRREAMRSRSSDWGQRGGEAASSLCFATSEPTC